MSYVYRCGSCRASAPPAVTRQAAEEVRDHHRATVHGGLEPAGEEIVRARSTAPARSADGTRYVSGKRVLIAIGALLVAETAARIYSRLR